MLNGNALTLRYTKLLKEGDIVKVVATKQNHYRHESRILVGAHIGIDENTLADFNIYPNPTNGILHIEGSEMSNIMILNVLGQEIKTVATNSDETVEIDCSDLPNGVYFVKISGKSNIIRRFIKQ